MTDYFAIFERNIGIFTVEVKLIVYKDFGHGISRPKEQLAAQWHNWQWFAKHIWGEEVEIPIEIEEEAMNEK